MTDEQMDARLRHAGEAWRAATDAAPTAVAEPVEVVPTVAQPRRAHRWLPAASAAVVAAGLVAGGVFVFAGGGHSTNAGSEVALKGTVWRLVQVGGGQSRPNSFATFYVGTDGSFVLDDSCEVTGGHATAAGGSLRLVPDDQRYRECTDTAGELAFGGRAEQTMFGTSKFTVDGSTLTLSRRGSATVHFAAAPALSVPTTDVPTFAGAKWQLAGRKNISLQVKNGRLATSDGCNTISARVLDGIRIDPNTVATTAIGCPVPVVVEAVDRMFGARSIQVHVQGTTLTLTAVGAAPLVYHWVPNDPAAVAPARLFRDWRLVSIAGDAVHGPVHMSVSHLAASVTFGCGAIGGALRAGTGTLRITDDPAGPAPGCTGKLGEQSSTVNSFLSADPALWSIRNGKLVIFGGGAQAFSLVFVPA